MSDGNEKSRNIREMFGSIAGRYDFLNHLLSVNFDRHWRHICVREIGKRVSIPSPSILDVGCGTGDLSLAFSRLGPVIGCDFCHSMLCVSKGKIAANAGDRSVQLLGADAMLLPFRAASFDIVVSAFVLRNLSDLERGLQEMRRVLRPGGILGVLEFGMPQSQFIGMLYRFYFLRILPVLGRIISGVDGPYGYLPASVQAFPPAAELKKMAERNGFSEVEYKLLTAGVSVLLIGKAG